MLMEDNWKKKVKDLLPSKIEEEEKIPVRAVL
jgi:hypothetical protein